MALTAALVLLFALGLVFLWYSGHTPSPSSPSVETGAPGAAAALEPEFEDWNRPAGGSSAALEKKLEEARAVSTANPQNGQAMASLGQVQLQSGRGTDAVASFQAAVEADPQNWRHRFDLAQAQCALARWDECINALREAQRVAPDNWAVSHNLGVALHRRGVDDVASVEFGKAKALAENQAAVHLGLAVSYDKLGRRSEAVEAYQAFLRLAPSTPLAERIRTRVSQLNAGG